jgi:hypothetical protein
MSFSEVQWKGVTHRVAPVTAPITKPRAWQPSKTPWTAEERSQFWISVRDAQARVLQGMEEAVRGLFFPPGSLSPVIIYSKAALLDLVRSQFTSSGGEADHAVERAVQARWRALVEGQNGSDSPAFV